MIYGIFILNRKVSFIKLNFYTIKLVKFSKDFVIKLFILPVCKLT